MMNDLFWEDINTLEIARDALFVYIVSPREDLCEIIKPRKKFKYGMTYLGKSEKTKKHYYCVFFLQIKRVLGIIPYKIYKEYAGINRDSLSVYLESLCFTWSYSINSNFPYRIRDRINELILPQYLRDG